MAHRLLPAVIALALLPLAGCAGREPADPLVVIAGPKAFSGFELSDADDRVIWRVAADVPAPVVELFYGETPTGFRQEAPAGRARPRPLVVGELLTLKSITPLRVFHHEGYVASRRQLSVEHWEMKLRGIPAPAKLDIPAPAELDPPASAGLDDAATPP